MLFLPYVKIHKNLNAFSPPGKGVKTTPTTTFQKNLELGEPYGRENTLLKMSRGEPSLSPGHQHRVGEP
jgi:hypothetical protein